MDSARRASPQVIDFHAHWYPDDCVRDVTRDHPRLELIDAADGRQVLTWNGNLVMSVPPDANDPASRLGIMDETGIDVQILSVGALDTGWAGLRGAAAVRRINEALAEVCRESPGRFRFLAALPFGDNRVLVDELTRSLALGAVGVGITTTIGGLPLDAPELHAFWREMDRLGLIVMVHPTCCPTMIGDRAEGSLLLLSDYLAETALAATRLIMAGLLEEFPSIRLVWSHLGGALPMFVGRLDAGRSRFPKCARPPSDYLRRCFYDTVCTHGPALDCARASFGAGALLFGTDEPHRMETPKAILATVRGRPWPEEDLRAVLAGNATRLLFETGPGPYRAGVATG